MPQSREIHYDKKKNTLTIVVDLGAGEKMLRISKTGRSYILYATPSVFEQIPDTDYAFKLLVTKRKESNEDSK